MPPYQLYGGRFTRELIVQMVLAEADLEYELAPYPARRDCKKLVSKRPVLRPFFDEFIKCRLEYAKMQATDGGVK